MARERRKWSLEEDALLRAAVQESVTQEKPHLWREVARNIPGRTNKDCRRRWCNALNTDISKGPWSEEEDERLWNAVRKHGTRWAQVALEVGSRNSDQCSSHWSLTLNPDINYSDWTADEDERLLREVRSHGTNWSSVMAKHYPSRTTLALKNRYSALKNKASQGKARTETEKRRRVTTQKRRRRPGARGDEEGELDADSQSSDNESDNGDEDASRNNSLASDEWSKRLSTTDGLPSTSTTIVRPTTSTSDGAFSAMMTPGQPYGFMDFSHNGGYSTPPISHNEYESMYGAKSQVKMLPYAAIPPHSTDQLMTTSAFSGASPHNAQQMCNSLTPVSMHQFTEIPSRPEEVYRSASSSGLDMQSSSQKDPFALRPNLQQVSIDAVCTSSQLGEIVNSLVGTTESITVKVRPYEP